MEDAELQRALEASLADAHPSAATLAAMSAQEQDQLTISQLNEINASLKSQAMVGPKESVEVLTKEYEANPMQFAAGIAGLRYKALRRVRKDGNCFYRGFLYRYLEYLTESQNRDELARIQDVVRGSKAKLLQVGYDESAIDMFWEMLVELLDQVPTLTLEALHEKMNDENGVSPHVVWFCRALSATHIKLNVDQFAPFIMDENGNVDVEAFCRTEVEPVNHECEQVQIIALTDMLHVPVAIEYLDGSGETSCIVFPDGAQPNVTLLYRPGHYDILYEV